MTKRANESLRTDVTEWNNCTPSVKYNYNNHKISRQTELWFVRRVGDTRYEGGGSGRRPFGVRDGFVWKFRCDKSVGESNNENKVIFFFFMSVSYVCVLTKLVKNHERLVYQLGGSEHFSIHLYEANNIREVRRSVKRKSRLLRLRSSPPPKKKKSVEIFVKFKSFDWNYRAKIMYRKDIMRLGLRALTYT